MSEPGPLFVIAGLLAAQDPRVWQRLLADHVADDTGHCRTCGRSTGAVPVWPCRLAIIAEEARRLAVDRRA